ncbi:MAG: hypothetical protein HKO58_03060, partial [Gammaproteobacteria bacterium]|nr:hypothetical protein [Gammaproteobacteria bacterium]
FPIQPSIVTNDQFSVVFPEVKRVGYHTWADANTAYVFLVDPNPAGERHTLEVVARNSGKSRQIASTIGRSLVMQPETDHLVFVDKSDSKNWLIKTYNPTTTLAVEMLNALNGSEDMAWLDKENLLMASGNEIYLNTSENGYGENWQLVSGNSLHDLPGTISRLAVSPDLQWLALVVSK